jgi:hypothetical protein
VPEYIKVAGRWSFGDEGSNFGVAAGTKNKWLGLQNGEWNSPAPEYEVKPYYGSGGSHDPLTQAVKRANLEASFPLVAQHAYPYYWYFGGLTEVNHGDGTHTHQIRGTNTRRSLTMHQVLGDGSSEQAIDWLGGVANQLVTGVEEDGELYCNIDAKFKGFTDAVTPVAVTALTRDPYLWSTATWAFYNPGTTNALTGLTTPSVLSRWEYTGNHNVRDIRGHANSNARFPATLVRGRRSHELSLGLIPAADLTLFQKLVKDRTKFDFVYRLTRGTLHATLDYIEFRFLDCFAKTGKHNTPEEDAEIRVDVPCQPRVVEIDARDTFSTLLAAA